MCMTSDAMDYNGRPSLRELEILRAMIATRKMVAAAHLLGISQPAVSRAIASLEARVGRALFSRDGGRLVPTPDAFALEAEAVPLFRALERIALWPNGGAVAGVLRLAAAPTLAQFVLPATVAHFREIEPDLVIHVQIGTGTDVINSIAERSADLGIIDAPVSHPGIRVEPFREAVAHCIMPLDHRLAGFNEIVPGDLAGEPMIALSRRFASRVEIDRVFAGSGIARRIVTETTTSIAAVEMVRHGIGITLVNPYPISMGGLDGLVARPFVPAVPYSPSLLFPAVGSVSPLARRVADAVRAMQPEDGLTKPLY
jgi:DNA-binding transcriptional LysR family regulator